MVGIYLTTAIGVPVYMHYCGGELEKVSFLVKSNSCCGGDESDMDMGCCEDENAFARCAPDFTFEKVVSDVFQISDFNLFSFDVLFFNVRTEPVLIVSSKYFFPPPDILQSNIIRTTFLRI